MRLWVPGKHSKLATKVLKGFLLILLTASTFLTVLPVHAAAASFDNKDTAKPSSPANSPPPNLAGADPVPDLSLPQTILSNVDGLIGAGGTIQTSPDNLTLYNSVLAIRLLGGLFPQDQLVGPNHRLVGSSSFWEVQVSIGQAWVPLLPRSDSIVPLGTNSTGTFVIRTMYVGTGQYSGIMTIAYKATSAGPLKWDLSFAPSSSGSYRLVYNWNIAGNRDVTGSSKHVRVRLGDINYTLGWDDVPDVFNTTAITSPQQFSVLINLGTVTAGSTIAIDPNLISTNVAGGATAFSTQRKIFYEQSAGNYWVFYYDAYSIRYRYSPDQGANWYFPSDTGGNMPPGWPGYITSEVSLGPVLNFGQTVVLATGEQVSVSGVPNNGYTLAHLWYIVGTISGSSISWSTVYLAGTRPMYCASGGASCNINGGLRQINLALTQTGALAFSYNSFYISTPYVGNIPSCSSGAFYSESTIEMMYNGRFLEIAGTAGPEGGCYRYDLNDEMRSVLVTAITGVRIIYQWPNHNYDSAGNVISTTIQLNTYTLNTNVISFGGFETIDSNVAYDYEFSGVSDTNYGTHIVYRMSDGSVNYAYRPAIATASIVMRDIFTGSASFPQLTLDSSSNDVYASAIQGSSIVIKGKSAGQNWSDKAANFPVTNRNGPVNLSSNYASTAGTNASRISLIWVEACSPFCNLMYAGIPIPSVWSPFAATPSPWDGNGIVPFGQYFSNLGESVSPSTGMLTVRQTDLSVPGRGLDLSITRVYTDPSSFLGGNPYNVETLYGFRDDSFTTRWTALSTINFATDGDVATLTVNSASVPYGQIVSYVNINTAVYPYLVWRFIGSNRFNVGVFAGGVEYKYAPPDPLAPSAWSTVAWNVNAVTGGKTITEIELFAVGNVGDWVKYDYLAAANGLIGNGWQLNFPWMSYVSQPSYLHLWDGQGYRIPVSFWSGLSATFENHQGTGFRLGRSQDGTISLSTSLGTTYHFDTVHRLTTIADATGNNTIAFNYDSSNRISNIVDTLQRVYLFCYDSNLPMELRTIYQTTSAGTCTGSGAARSIQYAYDNNLNLASVTDAAGRTTAFSYSFPTPGVQAWLLTQVTYPTQWASTYTYTAAQLGTEAAVYAFRVATQNVVPRQGPGIRSFQYTYNQGAGDQIIGATVRTFNGTSATPVSYTDYAFSFAGMTKNVSDTNHRLISGIQQRYGIHGEVIREIHLVTAQNVWYFTTTSPASGWASNPSWYYDQSWRMAPAVANETQPYPPWGPLGGWSDTFAKWIWANVGATTSGIAGPIWFRTTFYQTKATNAYLEVDADNGYTAYLNGANIGSYNGLWNPPRITNLSVPAGWNVLAIYATNPDGPDPGEMILSLHDSSTNQVLVRTDDSVGSYTNSYRYDLWGNMIYSHLAINPFANLYQDNFYSYYNDATLIGYYYFIDSFSDSEGNRADNPEWSKDFVKLTPDPCCPIVNNRDNMGVVDGKMHFDVDGYPITYYFYSPQIPISGSPPHWTVSFDWIANSTTTGGSVTQLAFDLKLSNGTIVYVNQLVAGGTTAASGSYLGDLTGIINNAIANGNTWVKLAWHITSAWYYSDYKQTGDVYNLKVSPGASFSNSFMNGFAPGPPGLNTWLYTKTSPSSGWNYVTNWSPAGGWTPAPSVQNYNGPPWGTIPGFVDTNAQWIWWNKNSWNASTQDPVWFRRVFYVPTAISMNIEMTADNAYWLYLDGNSIDYNQAWTTRKTYGSFALTPGYHVLGIEAVNFGCCNPAGLLLSASNAATGQILFHTDGVAAPNIIGLAGQASFQNGSIPSESYLGYTSWGAVSQTQRRLDTPSGPEWVTSLSTYDGQYGNLKTTSDPMGNMAYYTYSSQGAFLTNMTQGLTPALFSDFNNGTFAGWTVSSGSWTVPSGELSSSGTGDEDISSGQTSWALNIVQSRVKILSGQDVSIDFLWDGGGNHYRMQTWDGYQTLRLYKSQAGVYTQLAYAPLFGIFASQWHTWRIAVSGGTIRLYIDGVQYIQYTDPSPYATGKVRLRSLNTQTHYDDVLIGAGKGGASQLYSYDLTTGNLLSSTDPMGSVTNYQYDILGRVTKISYPPTGADFVQYTYNDAANFVDSTNENGWKTRQIYDGLGRLTISDKISGSATYANVSYAYDWSNNVVGSTDVFSKTYHAQYDAVGRSTSEIGPDGNFTQQSYDDLHNWVRSSDQNGNSRCDVYDRLGRLISVIDMATVLCQAGIASNYSYDLAGNLVKLTNSNNQTTLYSRDNLNRLKATTFPDSSVESYLYDNDGNLVKKIDQKNTSTIFTYDALNRLSHATYCNSAITSDNYLYDANGRIVTRSSVNATVTYTYDARGRITGETDAVNAPNENYNPGCTIGTAASTVGSPQTYHMSYSYQGETLRQIAYPDGLKANYTYDPLGRIASVFTPGGRTYATFSYNKDDSIRGIGFGDGSVGNYTYDTLGRMIMLTLKNAGGTTILSLSYGYDKAGEMTSSTGQVNSQSVSEAYIYDALGRLTNATLANGSSSTILSYQYDNMGNRLVQSQNGVTTNYSYNATNNELKSYSAPGVAASYGYDPLGDLLSRTTGASTWTYVWDTPGHLLKALNNGSTQAAYAYDASGRRMESIEGGTTTFYAYLGAMSVYQVASGTSTDHILADGLRIGTVSGKTGSYYHEDALGSTRLVTSMTKQTILFADSYQPFGQDSGTPTGSATYKFTGEPYSATTGLYYYLHRWYDPAIGRFISTDPYNGKLTNPLTLNLYIYTVDRPTGFTDPNGLDACNGWDWNTWGGCVNNTVQTVNNAGQAVSNWWNSQDSQTKAAIILVIATVAIVATAGVAAPFLLPTIAIGIGIGAGISTGSYVGIQLATGGQITASGLFFAAASGAFLGAVGALAAPLGGSLAESIGFKASSIVAKVISNSLVFGAAIDVGLASGQRDPVKLALSGGLAIVGGESGDALAGELGAETTGMTSLQQSGRFAPRIAAFLRVSPNAGGVVAGDIAGGILGGFLDYLYKLAEPGLP